MNDKKNNSNSEDKSFSDSIEDLFDDLFAPTKPEDAPDSKEKSSTPDTPLNKTVKLKTPIKKPLSKKTTTSVQPSSNESQTKQDTPITKEKSPSENSSKIATQNVSHSDNAEVIFDDLFAPTKPEDAPDSKKESSTPDTPLDKTVKLKTPITKEKSPSEDSSKIATKNVSHSDSIEDIFDDLLAPTKPEDTPDSKEESSTPDTPSDKTVQQKVPTKKPLSKKTTTSVQPSISESPVKQDTPITKKESPSEDSSKTATQKTPQNARQKIEKIKLRDKPKKSLNTLIFVLLIFVLVLLSMFTGKIMDYDVIMDFFKINNSLTFIRKAVSIDNANEKKDSFSKDIKAPSLTEDFVESKIEKSDIQGPDTIKKEEENQVNAAPIPSGKSADEISNVIKKKMLSYPYSIYLGSYSSISKVKKASSDYMKLKIPSYWIKIDLGEKGVWYRLFGGYFQTREETDEFIKTWHVQGAESRLTKYANLIGIYTSEEDIGKHKAHLEELGYSPYIISDTEDTYRLYVGAFFQKVRAEEQKYDLALKGIQSEIVER